MVSETLCCRVDTATDIEAFAIPLPKPRDNYILVFWYRDTSYASDSFGCTATPNIYHWWILDRNSLSGQVGVNVPHVNLFGSECRAEVYFSGLQFFKRDGLKALISGYIYGGNYSKFAYIVDLSNPSAPTVVKQLTDGSAQKGDWWNLHVAYYHPETDEIWFGDIRGNIYYAPYTTFLGLTDFQGGTKLISNVYVTAQVEIYRLTSSKLYAHVYDVNRAVHRHYIIDPSAHTYSSWTPPKTYNALGFGMNYMVGLTTSGSTIVGIDLIDKSTLAVSKSISVSISFSRILHVTDYVSHVAIFDTAKIILVNISTGAVKEIAFPNPLYGYYINTPYVYGFKWVSDINTTGELVEDKLDEYYYFDYDPTTYKATLKNTAGDPVPNKTVYIGIPGSGKPPYSTLIAQATTDANGQIDLSTYSNRVVTLVSVSY
ncbi:MAG: hypothetical protein C0179_02000 [Fervidicoccus sp.]|nr:MAG: hypothetical protein C0179_02000 [Fervidicoccus sp.]